MEKNMEKEMDTEGMKEIYRDPSIQNAYIGHINL